ncbi:lytic transglycosylase domain-containing protein [Paenibacillus psychroresistens]|nr:lytic transglycosylase domain-containing protein [Paenibacillus psychroresistens]
MAEKGRAMKAVPKKYILTLLLVILLGILYYQSNWLARIMYPIKYREAIEANAAKYGVDPLLVAAIIRVESNYKPELISIKGAVGLMQIMPDTAKWILEMEGFSKLSMDSLYEPKSNIMMGTKYINLLNKQFNSNMAEVLAAYNAGPGNVSKWRESNIWDGKLESIDQIRFWETRKYVDRVVYYYKKYQKIYM